MRKKLFRANQFVLVLFISGVNLASRSIFQTFVHLRTRVLYKTLFVFVLTLAMYSNPGELIPEKLTQILQNNSLSDNTIINYGCSSCCCSTVATL